MRILAASRFWWGQFPKSWGQWGQFFSALTRLSQTATPHPTNSSEGSFFLPSLPSVALRPFLVSWFLPFSFLSLHSEGSFLPSLPSFTLFHLFLHYSLISTLFNYFTLFTHKQTNSHINKLNSYHHLVPHKIEIFFSILFKAILQQ